MERSFCIFGDSISQAAYISDNWIERFRKFLETKYPQDFINIYNLGIGGNTTNDILKRFANESKMRKPTSLIFQIGTNDSGYFRVISKPIVAEEIFKSNILKLIVQAKNFTNDITFIGLAIGDDTLTQPLPQSSKGKTYIKERIDVYNSILKQTALENGCKFITISKVLGNADFSDGLHPNGHGHELIFNEVKSYF